MHRDIQDRLYGVAGSWSFTCCRHCRSLWLNPRPIDDELWRCYPSTYFTHDGIEGASSAEDLAPRLHGRKGAVRRHVLASSLGYRFDDGPPEPTLAGRLLARLPPIRRKATHGLGPLLPRWQDGGRLLDVGCGNGAYLALIEAYGWDVLGQDVDPLAAKAARRNFGVAVTTEPLPALAAREPSFDVVTASHVMEHVPDPVDFLDAAARCLSPGGTLVVVTPNASALGRWWFGDDWYPLQPPQHLVLCTPDGLRQTLRSVPALAGAKIRTLSRTARKVYRLGAEVRRHGAFRTGQPTPPRDRRAARLFGVAEAIATLVAPVGEELVASARRAVR